LAVLNIPSAPNAILFKKTQRVKKIDWKIQQLIDDMIETMYDAQGVGLAANQVGVPYRICVIGIPEEEEVRVLINPEIIVAKGERELEEGCLSVPGYRGTVKRSTEVRVRAKDRNGNSIRIKAENDLLAQALEHEIDHLNGILYLDRLVDPNAIWELSPIESDPSHSDDEEASLSPI